MLRTALFMALLVPSARSEAPVRHLRTPTRVLPNHGRALEGGMLMVSPGARTVVLRDEDKVQVWSGETGALLTSTFPRAEAGAASQGCGGIGCGLVCQSAAASLQPFPLAYRWVAGAFEVREEERILQVDPSTGASCTVPEPPHPQVEAQGDAIRCLLPDGTAWTGQDDQPPPPARSEAEIRALGSAPGLVSPWVSEDGSILAAVRHTPALVPRPGRGAPLRVSSDTLLVWRQGSARPLRTLPLRPGALCILASDIERRWMLCDQGTGEVQVLDLRGAEDRTIQGSLCFWWPERGAFLVAKASGNAFELWELGADQPRLRFDLPEAEAGSGRCVMTFSPDARWLAALHVDPLGALTFELWDLEGPDA